MATEESINSKPTGAEAIISNVSGQKNAVKMIWRDPETRDAFVYWADADTGLPLTSTDGYNLVEGGSFAQPATQAAPAPAQSETPAAPVDPSIYETNQGSGGEAFDPYEAKAIAEEMTKLPGAKVDPQTGIISAPTPSSGGYISFDPNTGWSAYTNADGITTTFNANGDIIGGPGLSTVLGTKSGAFLGDKVFSPADIPIVGALLSGPLNAIKGAVEAVVGAITGKTGSKTDTTAANTEADNTKSLVNPVERDPFTGAGYRSINPQDQDMSNKGSFAYGSVSEDNDGDPATGQVVGGKTTPAGVTTEDFMGTEGSTQGFYGRDPTSTTDLGSVLGYFSGDQGAYDGSRAVGTGGTVGTGVGFLGDPSTTQTSVDYAVTSGFGDKDVIDALNAAAEEAGLKGWTNDDAIAFAANFAVENAALNGDWNASRAAWNNENSYGLAQWNEATGRFGQLVDFSKQNNLDWTTLEAQSKFTIHELQNDYKSAWGQIKAAPNLAAKTAAVAINYEKPADLSKTSIDKRTQEAARIASGDLKGTPLSGTTVNSNVQTFAVNDPQNFSDIKDSWFAQDKSLAQTTGTFKGYNEDNVTNTTSKDNTQESLDSLAISGQFSPSLLSGPTSFYGGPAQVIGNEPSSRSLLGAIESQPTSVSNTPTSFMDNVIANEEGTMGSKALSQLGINIGNTSAFSTPFAADSVLGSSLSNTPSTSTSSVSVPSGFFGQEGGVPQPATEEKGWQQSIVDAITPAIAPTLESVIGWGVSKALEGFNQQSQQNTQLGQISDPRGSISSIGSPPSSVSTDPTQTGPVAWGMEQSYLDSLEKDSAYRDAFDSANKASLSDILGVSDDRSMFSGFGLFDSGIGDTSTGGISVSGNAATGGAGSYSGPSGWETSGDAGIYDSLGSDTAIDYGNWENSGGGVYDSLGPSSAVGTTNTSSTNSSNPSGTTNAGSGGWFGGNGAGDGSVSLGSGGASSATSNSNSNPGSTSASGYSSGMGGWDGSSGWW